MKKPLSADLKKKFLKTEWKVRKRFKKKFRHDLFVEKIEHAFKNHLLKKDHRPHDDGLFSKGDKKK